MNPCRFFPGLDSTLNIPSRLSARLVLKRKNLATCCCCCAASAAEFLFFFFFSCCLGFFRHPPPRSRTNAHHHHPHHNHHHRHSQPARFLSMGGPWSCREEVVYSIDTVIYVLPRRFYSFAFREGDIISHFDFPFFLSLIIRAAAATTAHLAQNIRIRVRLKRF